MARGRWRIDPPALEREGDTLRVRYPVEGNGSAPALEYRLPIEHTDLVSRRCDAAVVGLILPAMVAGADLEVRGPVSEGLVWRLSGSVQALLRTFQPRLHTIDVVAAERQPARGPAPGVVTGFSCGIDSFATLAEYHYGTPPAESRLTHLVFNDVGSHGAAADDRFERRYRNARAAADEIGLPLVPVRSNLDRFFDLDAHSRAPARGMLHFQQSHTLRNASVPFLLQAGIGRFLYSSASHYRRLSRRRPEFLDDLDPLTLQGLTTGDLLLASAGFHLDRVEKTALVADLPEARRHLDVCVINEDGVEGNCGACFKCLRTLLTLEVLGRLDEFADRFPMDRYRRLRNRQIVTTLQSPDAMLEVLALHMRRRRFPVPLHLRLLAALRLDNGRRHLAEAARLPGRVVRRLLR